MTFLYASKRALRDWVGSETDVEARVAGLFNIRVTES